MSPAQKELFKALLKYNEVNITIIPILHVKKVRLSLTKTRLGTSSKALIVKRSMPLSIPGESLAGLRTGCGVVEADLESGSQQRGEISHVASFSPAPLHTCTEKD